MVEFCIFFEYYVLFLFLVNGELVLLIRRLVVGREMGREVFELFWYGGRKRF